MLNFLLSTHNIAVGVHHFEENVHFQWDWSENIDTIVSLEVCYLAGFIQPRLISYSTFTLCFLKVLFLYKWNQQGSCQLVSQIFFSLFSSYAKLV